MAASLVCLSATACTEPILLFPADQGDAGTSARGAIGGDRGDAPQLEAPSIEGSCRQGFELDGLDCADIDECATDNGHCGPAVKCMNTRGGFRCGECLEGYLSDATRECRPGLSGLEVTPGTLVPAFAPTNLQYTVALASSEPTLQVTARAPPDSTISIDGTDVPQASQWQSGMLESGETELRIVVRQAGLARSSYRLIVTRATPSAAPTSIATQSDIGLEGTAWLKTSSTGPEIKRWVFNADGSMSNTWVNPPPGSYSTEAGENNWSVTGDRIHVSINDSFAEYDGTFDALDSMSGTASNVELKEWTWSATRMR
jgi:hypothetical protein